MSAVTFDRGRPCGAVGREQLQPDDRILLYTGVTEARSPTGALLLRPGTDRPARTELRRRPSRPGDQCDASSAPCSTTNKAQLTDDATLLLLEWRNSNTDALTP
jgi:serine phosphatase RsbU (regulator of sigma subunit)